MKNLTTPSPTLTDILQLLTIPMLGPGRIRRLLEVFRSADKIFRAPSGQLMQIHGIDHRLIRYIKRGFDADQVAFQLSQIKQHQVHPLTFWDERYPARLKATSTPPVILFCRGMIPDTWPDNIGVVGTRLPTRYGKSVTEKIVAALVENGLAITSGLARGVDTLAHNSCLQHGGTTFAVLGCGADRIYPPENAALFRNIQRKGTIISEYPLGTMPDGVNFPQRNRIISGFSLGVLVVEAGPKSGALITANYALEQNREVFAIPGPLTSQMSAGPNRLIQQGAKLVMEVDDIIEEIEGFRSKRRPAEKMLPPGLTSAQLAIFNHLGSQPKHIDKLVLELSASPASLLADLLGLELLGAVKQLPGKMFVRM